MMKNYQNSVNNVAAEGDDLVPANSGSKGTATAPSLTQEQFEKLMSLLQSSYVNHASGSATSNQVRSFLPAYPSATSKQGTILTNYSNSLICNNIALDTWIIDSGASHHICATLSWFQSYSEITPMIIKLPNGNHVTTKFVGTIVFYPDFSLNGVLVVPNFNINLFFVSSLCHNAHCLVKFTNTSCIIQE
jgi:hypothetical protein